MKYIQPFCCLAMLPLLFLIPSESRAQTTIANVTVTVNGAQISPVWSPQALNPGQSLVLAQNATPSQTMPVYDFDSSDTDCAGIPGNSGCPAAVISFTADGKTFTMTDTNQVLTLKDADPGCCTGNITFNEAQNYTMIGNPSPRQVVLLSRCTLATPTMLIRMAVAWMPATSVFPAAPLVFRTLSMELTALPRRASFRHTGRSYRQPTQRVPTTYITPAV